jgi:hypothetical protein
VQLRVSRAKPLGTQLAAPGGPERCGGPQPPRCGCALALADIMIAAKAAAI